jgi:outer membrane protein assembly complex protein YaeT
MAVARAAVDPPEGACGVPHLVRFVRKLATTATVLLIPLLSVSGALWAGPGTVERITVQGLSRMDIKGFMWLLDIAEGDPYDEAQLRRQFRVLWDKHLFEDITIESEDGPDGGKVLVIKVRERPVLASIQFEENKVLTRTQIEDHLKERAIDLRLGQALDLGQVYFAEAAIRDLFAQKGFLDATVEGRVTEVTTTSRALEFTMTPGGKTRIRRIQFTGNEVFGDRKLKKMLNLVEERKWYWPWSAKNLYHPVKWDQDVSNIRDVYQNRGHLDIETHAPIVEVRRKKQPAKEPPEVNTKEMREPIQPEAEPAAPPGPTAATSPAEPLTPKQQKKLEKQRQKEERKARERARKAKKKESRRWVYLSVPITEGPAYELGEISLQGNEVFSGDVLRRQIPMVDGTTFNNGALKVGVNRITRMYEDRGYLYASVLQRIERRDDGKTADVSVNVEEDRPYRVGRVEFSGNSATHDRVLRREMRLEEGELFSRSKLDLSRAKVNQLGYFQVPGEPVIEPIETEDKVRIVLAGQEQGRNEIQVGGGFSGLEGAFFSGIYSTRNFLGRGQVLSTAAQIGGRSTRYQITFQEPWFLGRPYLFGLSLFRRDTDYGNSLQSTSTGGGILLGRRLGTFSRVTLGYNFEEVTSSQVTTGTSTGQGVVLETENEISSLTPVYSFSTLNNPYRPSRGTSFSTSVQVAGGPLGGTVSYFKPQVNFTRYQRVFGRSFFAVHAEAGMVEQFGDLDVVATSNVEGVPRYQRFWLGGDTLGPRVFETRTITPRRFVRIVDGVIVDVVGDITGLPPDDFIQFNGVPVPIEVGGDRMYLLQSEWVFPLNEQADLALFVDVGDALFEDTDLDFSTTRSSAGVELRFHLPIFPVPLRLIYGVPLREFEGDETSNFTFSIGRSF